MTVLARDPGKIPAAAGPNVHFVPGDLRDPNLDLQAMAGCDAVVHNALMWADGYLSMFEADTRATVRMVDHAVRLGVGRMIFTSSVAAFGEYLPRMTERDRSYPIDPYGATKAAGEAYVFAAGSAISVQIVRPGLTFGEGAYPGAPAGGGPLAEIIERARRGEAQTFGATDGAQLMHAADLAQVYIECLRRGENRFLVHAVGPEHVYWTDLARLANPHAPIEVVPSERAAPYVFDTTVLETFMGRRFDYRTRLAEFVASTPSGGPGFA